MQAWTKLASGSFPLLRQKTTKAIYALVRLELSCVRTLFLLLVNTALVLLGQTKDKKHNFILSVTILLKLEVPVGSLWY